MGNTVAGAAYFNLAFGSLGSAPAPAYFTETVDLRNPSSGGLDIAVDFTWTPDVSGSYRIGYNDGGSQSTNFLGDPGYAGILIGTGGIASSDLLNTASVTPLRYGQADSPSEKIIDTQSFTAGTSYNVRIFVDGGVGVDRMNAFIRPI